METPTTYANGVAAVLEPALPLNSTGLWRSVVLRMRAIHCRLMHRSISHPIHGKYTCWVCLRQYPVEW